MSEPKAEGKQTQEKFEWVQENGQFIKITEKNSNGRKCLGCGCNCPCSCSDCFPICCTTKHKIKNLGKKKEV